jgi:hypothetical protein
MGRHAELDEPTDATKDDTARSTRPATSVTTTAGNHNLTGEGEARGDDALTGVSSRRTATRSMAKEEASGRAKTATKRAIEHLAAVLKQGPRDGAERLRALRQRIRDKEAVNCKHEAAESKKGAKRRPDTDGGTTTGAKAARQVGECGEEASSVEVNEYSPGDPTASSSAAPWADRLEVRLGPSSSAPSAKRAKEDLRIQSKPFCEPHAAEDPLVAEIKRRRRSSGHGREAPGCGSTVDKARRQGIG